MSCDSCADPPLGAGAFMAEACAELSAWDFHLRTATRVKCTKGQWYFLSVLTFVGEAINS